MQLRPLGDWGHSDRWELRHDVVKVVDKIRCRSCCTEHRVRAGVRLSTGDQSA